MLRALVHPALHIVLVGLALGACTVGVDPERDGGRDGGGDRIPGCAELQDMDLDGIADVAEGTGDTDADGVPNVLDTDSDDDGVGDADEHVGVGPCAHADHDGDGVPDSHTGISPAPHSFDDTVTALRDIGAHFIGVGVDGFGRMDMSAMAARTGSVDGSGTPLFFEAASGQVSDVVIDGIRVLAGSTPQDVTTRLVDVLGNPGGLDATEFILSITPVMGYGSGGAGTGFSHFDDTTFYGAVPGTSVEFDVVFENEIVPPPLFTQVFQCRIDVLGNGVARLERRNVYIIVPPDGSEIVF